MYVYICVTIHVADYKISYMFKLRNTKFSLIITLNTRK